MNDRDQTNKFTNRKRTQQRKIAKKSFHKLFAIDLTGWKIKSDPNHQNQMTKHRNQFGLIGKNLEEFVRVCIEQTLETYFD